MDTTRIFDLLVKYREGYNLNAVTKNLIVVDEEPSFSQSSLSSPLFFDSVEMKFYFPLLIDSIIFGIVDYEAHIYTKIDSSIDHVLKILTRQGLIALHHSCESERPHLLIRVAMSNVCPKSFFCWLPSTGSRKNFLYVQVSTAWLCDWLHFFHLSMKLIVFSTVYRYTTKTM